MVIMNLAMLNVTHEINCHVRSRFHLAMQQKTDLFEGILHHHSRKGFRSGNCCYKPHIFTGIWIHWCSFIVNFDRLEDVRLRR